MSSDALFFATAAIASHLLNPQALKNPPKRVVSYFKLMLLALRHQSCHLLLCDRMAMGGGFGQPH